MIRQILKDLELPQELNLALQYLILGLILSLPVVLLAQNGEVRITRSVDLELGSPPLVLDECQLPKALELFVGVHLPQN